MQNNKILGSEFKLYDIDQNPIAFCKSSNLLLKQSLINATTKSSGNWSESVVGTKDWSIDFAGLVSFESDFNLEFFTTRMYAGEPFFIKLAVIQETFELSFFGEVLIENITLTADQDEIANYQGTLKGVGVLQATNEGTPDQLGYIRKEEDPVFQRSPAGTITNQNKLDWNTAVNKIFQSVESSFVGNETKLVFTLKDGSKYSTQFPTGSSGGGNNGEPGKDGITYYPHIRYADSPTSGMSDNPAGKTYIGFATTTSSIAPTSYNDYTWSKYVGIGQDGQNGQSSYTYIRYSNDEGRTFTANNGLTAGDWLGTYVGTEPLTVFNPALFLWTKTKGETGEKGEIGNEGAQGIQGATPFGGKPFDGGRQYKMTSQRQEVVKYNGLFYATLKSSGNIPVGTLPTDAVYWEPWESFSAVATDLLLANDAYIGELGTGKVFVGNGIDRGWEISESTIKSIQKNANGTARTSLTSEGRLFANDASITGSISATSGNIGGIQISNNGLTSQNFKVDQNGILNVTNAVISGSITATSGSIGGFDFNNSTTGLNGAKIAIDPDLGYITKNGGLADNRGGHLILPLTKPANPVNGSVWLSDVLGDGGSPIGGGSGGGALSQLSDVTLSSPLQGQALLFDGTKWINKSVVTDLSSLGSLAYKNTLSGLDINSPITEASQDLNVSRFMRWRHYGNSHVIFDASSATAPDGQPIDRNNSNQPWSATYPTLMGWNGTNTYGVRVDSARIADNANLWGNTPYNGAERFSTPLYLMTYNTDTNDWRPSSPAAVNTFLGINTGSMLTNNVNGSSTRVQVTEPYDRDAANIRPNENGLMARFDFVRSSTSGTNGNYAGIMTFSPWVGTTASTGDASYQLAFGSNAPNGAGIPLLNIRKGIDSSWNSWYQIYHNGLDQHWQMRSTNTGTGYQNSTLELMSSNSPVLGMHWEGVVASTIGIESSGRIAIRNNPGNGYEDLISRNFQATNSIYTDGTLTANGALLSNTSIESKGNVHAGSGTNGGFTNVGYNAGHNNIWRLNNAPEYGLGYYQGGTDNIGFHFGNRNAPQHRMYGDGTFRNTGGVWIAADGTGDDPYGVMSVTRLPDGNNRSYYGMTRAGSIGIGMGISTANQFIIGGGSPMGNGGIFSSIWFSLDSGGNGSFGGNSSAQNFYSRNDVSAPHIYANNLLVIPTVRPANPVNGAIWLEG